MGRWMHAMLLGVLLAGCQQHDFATSIERGNVEAVRSTIDRSLRASVDASEAGEDGGVSPSAVRWGSVDELQYGLDRGMLELYEGDASEAVAWWQPTKVEMSRRLVTERAAASVTTVIDERLKRYAGLYHEYVLAPALLAMADCVSGGNDDRAYASQVVRHEREIQALDLSPLDDPPGECLAANAFTPYVTYMFSEAARSADTGLALERIAESLGEDHPFPRTLEEAASERDAVLHVVHLVGVAPPLRQGTDEAGEAVRVLAAGLVAMADAGVSQEAAVGAAAGRFPVREVDGSRGAGAGLGPSALVLGTSEGEAVDVQLHELADTGSMLSMYVREARVAELTRAAVRRILKTYAVDATGQAAGLQGAWRGLAAALLGAAEEADLRSWSLLPERFLAGAAGLREGETYIVRLGEAERTIEPRFGDRWLALAVQPSANLPARLYLGRLR